VPPFAAPRSFRLRGALVLLLGLLLVVGSPAARPVRGASAAPHTHLNGPPAGGSGALPAYPLNHTLDTSVSAVGTPPQNSGFEAAGAAGGTPPRNDDVATASTSVGTPPQNRDFESGDLSGWTTTGAVTVQSDHSHYAKLGSAGGTLTSAAFSVDPSAQALSVDVGYLTTSGYSWVKISALTGPTYATSTALGDFSCSSCGSWATVTLDATPSLGQAITLQFSA